MVKIIISCASLQGGGAERVLSILSPVLLEHYDEVQYVMWYEAPLFYDIHKGIKLVSIEKEVGSKNTFRRMMWFRRYIKREKPNLILSFSAPFNMLTLASLLGTSSKVIACERVDPRAFRWGKHLEILRNLLYYKAEGILAQTQMSKEYFGGRLLRKTDVIFNPVTMNPEIVGAAVRTNKFDLIVSAARLAKQKRQDMLIECFARFKKTHPSYKLVIYGEGPERNNLIKISEELGVKDCVSLPGNVKDLWNKILPAKMFVMTSSFEGMSNSMIEAMCLGIPTISTKVSGATDLIKHKENGLLIDLDDKETLYEYMCRIADDNLYASKLGRNGAELYQLLDVESISKHWIQYIDSKIGK